MKIVEKWWRAWSVQILIAANVVAGLAAFTPELQEILPPDWYRYVLAATLIARVIKQNNDK